LDTGNGLGLVLKHAALLEDKRVGGDSRAVEALSGFGALALKVMGQVFVFHTKRSVQISLSGHQFSSIIGLSGLGT
jgi:hypothetical protein